MTNLNDMASSETLSAARKTCRILASLVDPGITKLKDIAGRTGLDVTTCLRLLRDLEHEGFVERDPHSKEYVLGTQVYAMHHAMVAGVDVRALARPSLIRLARRFGDSVILSVPVGWESVCADVCLGDYPIRANYLETGSRRPLGIGAGSLALLAGMMPSEQAAVLPIVRQSMKKRYPRFSPARLDEELARAVSRGHAVLLEVVVEKMGGIGVPVRSPAGRPIGALSIAALTERIETREQELADALLSEALAIERSWMPSDA